MPRIIGKNVINELLIPDKIAGGFCTVTYRAATTEERIAYLSAQWERKDGKIRNRRREALLDFGEMVILGFEEGYFRAKLEDGTLRIISSDPQSQNYAPEWKEILRRLAPDIFEAVAEHVFETPAAIARQADFEEYPEKN
jgi:hypothetical protein